MRIIVMFDLPTLTSKDKRNYILFRKFLIKNVYMMLQYSIYTKIAINRNAMDMHIKKLKINIPEKGLIQLLAITEKQFADMQLLLGEENSKNKIQSVERVYVI